MKSQTWLLEEVLVDTGTRCGVDPRLDIKRVRSRLKHEGMSFLTITLPELCKGFERGLEQGLLTPSDTPSFRWDRGLPAFLSGFLELVFERGGQLRADACPDAVFAVRQILLLHKKTLDTASPKRQQKALEAYIACENEVGSFDDAAFGASPLGKAFDAVSAIVWSDLLHDCPFGDVRGVIAPRHGPGATAERVFGNSKYRIGRWHQRLEEHFPFTEYGVASARNIGGDECPLAAVDFVEPDEEQPVRVIFVPKTMKTPRVIAIEPVCMQYMQQAILGWLVPQIERLRTADGKRSLTSGQVNFSDQSVNKKLALESSRNGVLATLDLSEASDRVSSSLVWRMLRCAPLFREHVFACRSTRASLPNGTIVSLNKFASMGSALCFPMEAMVFFIAMVSARLVERQLAPTRANVYRMTRHVYVYGDDILVPTHETPSILVALRAVGLKVNTHKSFWNGKFRESCGTDAYAGQDVTPVYSRHKFLENGYSVEAVLGWTSTANQFYLVGLWRTAKAIRDHVEKFLGEVPVRPLGSPGLGWVTYSNATTYQRWNKTLMRFECRTWVAENQAVPDPLSGDGALLKCFGLVGSPEPADREHLQTSRARGKLTLKRRWVPA